MFKNMSESSRIFVFKTLRAIADCLITVFIPIYILKITQNLMFAILFLVVRSLSVVIFNLTFKSLIQKHSIVCVVMHVFPIIISQAMLNFANIDAAIVVIIGLLMGLAQVLYSVSINLIFVYTDRKTNVRKLEISTNLGKFIFILISGWLLAKIETSFLFLSIISSLLYAISFIPLLSLNKVLKIRMHEQGLTKSTLKLPLRYKIFHIGMGSYQAFTSHLLPLFLYVNNLSFEAVTSVMAIVELIKMFMNYVAKHINIKDKHYIVAVSSYLVFITSVIFLLLSKNPVVLFLISCVLEAIFPLCFVPMFDSFCNYIKKHNMVADEMLIRDVDIFAPRPLIYCSYYIFSDMLLSFILATGLSALMFVGLIENKHAEQNNSKAEL